MYLGMMSLVFCHIYVGKTSHVFWGIFLCGEVSNMAVGEISAPCCDCCYTWVNSKASLQLDLNVWVSVHQGFGTVWLCVEPQYSRYMSLMCADGYTVVSPHTQHGGIPHSLVTFSPMKVNRCLLCCSSASHRALVVWTLPQLAQQKPANLYCPTWLRFTTQLNCIFSQTGQCHPDFSSITRPQASR